MRSDFPLHIVIAQNLEKLSNDRRYVEVMLYVFLNQLQFRGHYLLITIL